MWVTIGLQGALLAVVAAALAASLWLPARVLAAERRRRPAPVRRADNVVELAAWRARRR
ncbi:MAG: hypothetical protein U1E53_12140 [Dongiaceae bacterium]